MEPFTIPSTFIKRFPLTENQIEKQLDIQALNLKMNPILAKNCLLCYAPIQVSASTLKHHYNVCSQQYKVQCRFLPTRVIINSTSICYECGEGFNQEQWKIHSKRRHKSQRGASQVHFDIQNSSRRIQSISTSHTTPGASNLAKSLANIAYQYTFANVPLWISLNSFVSTKSLSNYFMLKLGINMGQVLTEKVPVVTEKEIKSLHIRNLKKVKPEELVNSTFVDNLLLTLTRHNQFKLISFLNKKARQTGSFEIRPLPKLDRQRRAFKPIKFHKLIHFLWKLISSGKNQIIHIGIDLLIIFQTGVRFVSDHELLQKQILQKNPTIYLKIKKTKGEAKISLPIQTLNFIQKTEWKGWHKKTLKLYKTMKSWSGMRGYTLKYTLLTYLYLIKPGQLNLNQTGHKSFDHLLPYLNVIQNELNRQALKSCEIPEISPTSNTWQTVEKISNQLFIGLQSSYEAINPDFFSNLIRLVYKNEKEYNDDNCTQLTPVTPSEKVAFHEKQPSTQLDIEQQQQEDSASSQSTSNISKSNTYIVFGTEVYGDFEQNLQRDLNNERVCIFCLQKYNPPLCSCLNSKPCIPLKSSLGSKQLDIKIDIPEAYFNRQFDPEYLKIRRLIALRRLKYTQEATCTFGEFPVDSNQKMSLQSEQFKKIRGKCYFPPLKIIRSGGQFLSFEESFGLAATAEIEPNTLIGQYAADVISSEYLQCSRRLDTIMQLGTVGTQELTITPVVSMGYVCLINCALLDDQQNCASLRLEINNETKVIIYSTRKIKPHEEVMYKYSQNFQIELCPLPKVVLEQENTTKPKIKEVKSRTPQKTTDTLKKIKRNQNKTSLMQRPEYFINTGADCYKNVVLKAFRGLLINFDIFQQCYTTKSTQSLDLIFNLSPGHQDCSQFLQIILKNQDIYKAFAQIFKNKLCLEKMCQNCKVFGQTFDEFDILPTESDFSALEKDLENVECPVDFVCEKCQILGQTRMRRSVILMSPKIIFMKKKLGICKFEKLIFLNNKNLEFEGAITYAGDGQKGHYMYFDGAFYFSDMQLYKPNQQEYRPYIAIYRVR